MDTSAIIDRLGGTKKTADLCGVTLAVVPPWRQTGIPPRHWQAIVDFAREHDIDGYHLRYYPDGTGRGERHMKTETPPSPPNPPLQ